MNKLEKAILLELKKSLIVENNQVKDIVDYIIEQIIEQFKDKLTQKTEPGEGETIQSDVYQQTGIPEYDLEEYLKEKIFTQDRITMVSNTIKDDFKAVKKTISSKSQEELVKIFISPFNWAEKLLTNRAGLSRLQKSPFKIFDIVLDKLAPDVTIYPLAAVYHYCSENCVFKPPFSTTISDNGLVELLINTLKINVTKSQEELSYFQDNNPKDDLRIKKLLGHLINRVIFNSKPQALFNNVAWGEVFGESGSLKNPTKIDKLINKGIPEIGQNFHKTLFESIKSVFKTRLEAKYDPGQLGFLLFSKESESWPKPDKTPSGFDNWIKFYKSLKLNPTVHMKPIAKEVKSYFEGENKDPFLKASDFVKKDGETPNPYELLIHVLTNSNDEKMLNMKKIASDAAKILNKKNWTQQTISINLNNNLQSYFDLDDLAWTAGFALYNYLLSKKSGRFGRRKTGAQRLELTEALDLTKAQNDALLEEILKAVKELNEME